MDTYSKLERMIHISRKLTYQFHDVNKRISEAWLELESARVNLKCLSMLYEEWLSEEGMFLCESSLKKSLLITTEKTS